jgi:hypothetical protein
MKAIRGHGLDGENLSLTLSNQIKSNQIIIYSRYRDTTYCNTNVLAGEP